MALACASRHAGSAASAASRPVCVIATWRSRRSLPGETETSFFCSPSATLRVSVVRSIPRRSANCDTVRGPGENEGRQHRELIDRQPVWPELLVEGPGQPLRLLARGETGAVHAGVEFGIGQHLLCVYARNSGVKHAVAPRIVHEICLTARFGGVATVRLVFAGRLPPESMSSTEASMTPTTSRSAETSATALASADSPCVLATRKRAIARASARGSIGALDLRAPAARGRTCPRRG